MKYATVIVAGGSGKRMGGDIPKQFMPLAGKPVLMHTVGLFHAFNSGMFIVVVLPKEHLATWHSLCEQHAFSIPHVVVSGGSERFHSVSNALSVLPEGIDIVAVHDGVRPFASPDTIARAFTAAEKYGAAIPVVPITDSLRYIEAGGESHAVNRSDFRAVQTPQCFRTDLLKKAYGTGFSPFFTDDASVVEASGNKIVLTEGNSENIKITTPVDLAIAEIIVRDCNGKKK